MSTLKARKVIYSSVVSLLIRLSDKCTRTHCASSRTSNNGQVKADLAKYLCACVKTQRLND